MGWVPTFEIPTRLFIALLIPLFVALYIWAMKRRGRGGMRFTNTSMLGAVVKPQRQWRRHVAVALSMLSLAALTIAFAKPFAEAKVPVERATVVVAIDVSQSMGATDVDPNRLDAAKQGAKEFIDAMPQGYNVAIVSMSNNPALRFQPGPDRGAAKRVIDTLQLQDGTAIGESIALGIDALRQAPGADAKDPNAVAPGAIVLLSDGESNSGRPALQGADLAKEVGVPVHTIAYGTPTGFVDLDGERHQVAVNAEQLKQVAEITGGTAYRAESAGQLKDVYGRIGSEVGYREEETEVTAQYVGWSFGFAVAASLAAISLAVRWP